MVNFSLGNIPGYNAGVQKLSDAANYTGLTKTNAQSGKSEWTGRAVALAAAGVTAGIATAVVLRYGVNSSAILKGLQDDTAAGAKEVKSFAAWSATGISSGASSSYAAFTGALGGIYNFVQPMPGQVAQGFSTLGTQMKNGFEATATEIGKGFGSMSQQLSDIQSSLAELLRRTPAN